MDSALKARWTEALRSGAYKQGDGLLHNQTDDSYCCLGVLCRVAGAEFSEFEGADEDGFLYGAHVPVLDGELLSAGEDEELRKSALSRFGLTDDVQRTLIEMNDHKSASFSDIADFIETNL